MNCQRTCEIVDPSTLVVASAVAETRKRWSSPLARTFVIREAADHLALEDVMTEFRPQILLLDIALPGLGRVEGLAAVQSASPATRLIVFSDRESESEGVAVLVAGAKGYCPQVFDPALLEKAVETVIKGELWIKRALVPALVAALAWCARGQANTLSQEPGRHRLERLTQRQRQVATAIARGESNKEIARRLNVTERTVKGHLTEMFRSVGVAGRMHLALLLNSIPGARVESSDSGGADSPQGNGAGALRQ
jgi:DNA-binding NarL/FixJ family response regulator